MSIGGRHIGSNQRINEPALLSIWSSDEMAWALACVAYWVQRWLYRNTSRSQVGQRCSIRTPPPAYPIFWTSIPLAANGVHVFAASFIYMNGDKPRSEYYHLRSICCYTTDFELNLQNEKISTNPQYSPSSPGLCAGEKSERTKQICFLLNPEDLHGNKKQRFKGRCVFTTVQSDPDAAHAQKTWGQWLYALQEVWVEQALFE